jgi:hypothetical protein
MQPGCTGTIVDDYCDVCGSPAGAVPFIPAGAAAQQPALAEEDRPTRQIPRVQVTTPPPFAPEVADSAAADPRGAGTENVVDEEMVDPAASGQGLSMAQGLPNYVGGLELMIASIRSTTWEVDAEKTDVVAAGSEGVDGEGGDAVAAGSEKTDTTPTSTDDRDTVQMPAVGAALSGGRHPLPQLPEHQVLGPVPVQKPADKGRFGSLAQVAARLAALLIGALVFVIGALVFANREVGGVTAQSVTTVTATATMPVSNSPSEPTIQLEDLADSARPFEAVRIQGTYRGGAGSFLRVQRWEGGKWLDFPLATKTDQSGLFITQAEFGQPGRYRLRVLDPDSGVTSKPFVVVIKG